MGNNATLQQYCKALRKALRISPKSKKLILQSVEADIAEYMDEHPNAKLADLEAQFGTPAAYARECVASMASDETFQAMQRRRKILRILMWVGIGILTVVLLLALYIAGHLYKYSHDHPGPFYYSETITDIVIETT